MSILHGLEMAKQALFAQQSALHTTSNNIANANTDGYSRQRVNLTTLPGYPSGSRNSPQIAGQLGTGVEAGAVERIRDQYLDHQYRSENSNTGYWETRSDALSRMEELMNEPSEKGLSKTLDQFWQSLQDLSTDPDSAAVRSVVSERGQDVADTFNYFSKRLQSFRSDEKKEIEVTVDEVNNMTQRVQEINRQVRKTESHGDLANQLYDERDQLLDKLSDMVNIKVSYSNGDSSTDIGEGVATIELVDQEGKSINQDGKSLTLVDGEKNARKELSFENNKVKLSDEDVDIGNMSGSLKGHVDAATVDYPEMLDNLNKMARAFGDAFNQRHREGYDLNGGQDKNNFFENIDSADTIKVNPDIVDNPDLIAANSDDGVNDGKNASALADVFDKEISFDEENGGEKATVKSYYQSLIAEMGVKTGKANKMKGNSDILRSQVENQRQSVSGVSLDEEMNNMIKFQHAYNAAARSMTTMDEMLDRVINNMGLVGR